MKLRNKALLIIGLMTLSFLGCASSPIIRYPLISFITLTLSFAILLYAFIRIAVTNRIELLNQDIAEITSSETSSENRILVDGTDEIASVANHVNLLLTTIHSEREKLDHRIQESQAELNKKSLQLRQLERVERHAPVERSIPNEPSNQDREVLTQIARYDNLTSLPNRVFFNEILNKAINHANRRNKILAVLLIDMDNFDKTYSKLGQIKSEIVLKELGKRFANTLRNEDILAKLDGDEFIVLLNDIGKSKFASTVAQKLLSVCSHPMKIDSLEFSLTASIGISIYPNDGNSLEDLLKNADKALFQAKSSGGNFYQFYTQEMDIEAREYIQLEAALRNAVHNNELTLYYQPKLRVRKGNITGVEALMRWEHPTLGLISPSKFIPLAEESGLIMQIGEWALREACRMTKFWQDEGYEHISVSLNLSPKQFHHPDLVKVINNAIKSTGLNPHYLELEIAENTVMSNTELAGHILDCIKTTGVQIALDHFGTGYTSISYLKQFPISSIKIDRNFIKGVPYSPNDTAITNTFIGLAHNLGLEVVAEGVETAEQVQYLSAQNCDVIQGYFLSHPLPAAKIAMQFTKLHEEVLV